MVMVVLLTELELEQTGQLPVFTFTFVLIWPVCVHSSRSVGNSRFESFSICVYRT